MQADSSSAIQWIPRENIDAEDRRFALSPAWLLQDSLVRSIREHGILSPLQVEEKNQDRFRPVMGFRRLAAAAELSLPRLPCLVRPRCEPLQAVVEALEENLSTRCLNLVEKACALMVLKKDFQVENEALLERFMPRLGIRGDGFHLQRYLALAALPRPLQEGLLNALEPSVALKLARWSAGDQQLFLKLASRFHLGRNRQKTFFALMDELKALLPGDAAAVTALWRTSGAEEIAEDEGHSSSEIFLRCFERLRSLRFPHLVEHERKYEKLRGALRLPPQLRMRMPLNFEGTHVDISLSFQDPEELLALARKLESLSRSEEIKEILGLL